MDATMSKINILKLTSFCIVIALAIICQSCKSGSSDDITLNKDETPIVSVNGKTLYYAELIRALPEGLNSADSAKAADAYIKMWINEELVYEKAKQNIVDPKEIDEQVEEYRQSLTVYTYQEQLLKEVLSKKITEKEMKDYYDEHADNLKLESSLIKGLFLKIPLSSPELGNLRKWYQSNSAESKEKIEKASIQNAVIYEYFYHKWVDLEEVTVNMPNTITEPSQFLKSNKNYETSDSTYAYLLHIEEYALPGTTAPFEYAKAQISDILINKYREDFLMKFDKDLYKDAIDNKNIKFYIDIKE
jgi:hypothetical protein